MNQDGTFETRKEIYEALFNGETLFEESSIRTHWYDKENDKFGERNHSGETQITKYPPAVIRPNHWRILKPKKRRVIKDYRKLAQALLDHGYVTERGHFENQWLFSIAGEPVDSWGYTESGKSFAQMYHDYRFHAIPFEATEEYDEDDNVSEFEKDLRQKCRDLDKKDSTRLYPYKRSEL